MTVIDATHKTEKVFVGIGLGLEPEKSQFRLLNHGTEDLTLTPVSPDSYIALLRN
jgi:hypothetical protein